MIVRFLHSARFALEGIFYALKTERNVQIWFGVLVANMLVALWLGVDRTEFLFLFFSTFAIGIAEYLNTAVEKLSDRVTVEREEIIKRVKDVAAGATFLASINALVVSLIIYIPKILEKFEISV